MLLSVKTLPDYYIDIIKGELNIKDVEANANMSDYVSYTVKPNSPVLGKTHGRFIPGIRRTILEMDQMALALKISNGENIAVESDNEYHKLSINTNFTINN